MIGSHVAHCFCCHFHSWHGSFYLLPCINVFLTINHFVWFLWSHTVLAIVMLISVEILILWRGCVGGKWWYVYTSSCRKMQNTLVHSTRPFLFAKLRWDLKVVQKPIWLIMRKGSLSNFRQILAHFGTHWHCAKSSESERNGFDCNSLLVKIF